MNEATMPQGKPGWRDADYCPEGLLQEGVRFDDRFPRDPIGAYSAFSNYCYSYATSLTVGTRIERFLNFHQFWSLLSQAQESSDYAEHFAGGIEHLTADQLDVRSSIYRAFWTLAKKFHLAKFKSAQAKRVEVLRCVDEALSRQNLKPHTHALLLCTKGELEGYRSTLAHSAFLEAVGLVEAIQESGELDQLIRVYRRVGLWYGQIGNEMMAGVYKNKAQMLARETGATDQLLKIGA